MKDYRGPCVPEILHQIDKAYSVKFHPQQQELHIQRYYNAFLPRLAHDHLKKQYVVCLQLFELKCTLKLFDWHLYRDGEVIEVWVQRIGGEHNWVLREIKAVSHSGLPKQMQHLSLSNDLKVKQSLQNLV